MPAADEPEQDLDPVEEPREEPELEPKDVDESSEEPKEEPEESKGESDSEGPKRILITLRNSNPEIQRTFQMIMLQAQQIPLLTMAPSSLHRYPSPTQITIFRTNPPLITTQRLALILKAPRAQLPLSLSLGLIPSPMVVTPINISLRPDPGVSPQA